MSDPITIGAGIGAGVSILRGGNPLKGAAVGGLGGAGYGALTGQGWAGNLLSQGGVLGNAATKGIVGSTGEIGSSLATTAGGLGTPPNLFDKIGSGLSSMGNYARENPVTTSVGLVAAQNLLQPAPPYQMNTPSPSAIPSQQSVGNYIPSHLVTEVQKPQIDVTAPSMGALNPYRSFGFGGANMFRDPREEYLNYPQY